MIHDLTPSPLAPNVKEEVAEEAKVEPAEVEVAAARNMCGMENDTDDSTIKDVLRNDWISAQTV
jgi:hypothetical protein